MFRLKICGVTTVEDAVEAVEAGADAIGLNTYERSKRFVDAATLQQLSATIRHAAIERRRKVAVVGLFVNADFRSIQMIAVRQIKLIDLVQLHGDESPDYLTRLPELPIVRARRIDDRGLDAIADDLRACRDAGRAPDAVLVDAAAPAGEYGGTGQTVSWPGVVDHQRVLGPTPLILAGGLTPDNVAEAIRTVRPYGVDVASGVESAAGVKDPIKVRDFIQAARAAFADEGIG